MQRGREMREIDMVDERERERDKPRETGRDR